MDAICFYNKLATKSKLNYYVIQELKEYFPFFIAKKRKDFESWGEIIEKEKPKYLFIIGGDGTLSLTLTQILNSNLKPKIVYLPTGDTNHFGEKLKINIENYVKNLIEDFKRGEFKKNKIAQVETLELKFDGGVRYGFTALLGFAKNIAKTYHALRRIDANPHKKISRFFAIFQKIFYKRLEKILFNKEEKDDFDCEYWKIKIDDKILNYKHFNLAIIGKFFNFGNKEFFPGIFEAKNKIGYYFGRLYPLGVAIALFYKFFGARPSFLDLYEGSANEIKIIPYKKPIECSFDGELVRSSEFAFKPGKQIELIIPR